MGQQVRLVEGEYYWDLMDHTSQEEVEGQPGQELRSQCFLKLYLHLLIYPILEKYRQHSFTVAKVNIFFLIFLIS